MLSRPRARQRAIRVGNAAYTRENGTFGATTLEKRHVKIHAGHLPQERHSPARALALADPSTDPVKWFARWRRRSRRGLAGLRADENLLLALLKTPIPEAK